MMISSSAKIARAPEGESIIKNLRKYLPNVVLLNNQVIGNEARRTAVYPACKQVTTS